MDSTLLALVKSMEVKVNLIEEERKAKEFYDLGVAKMNEARGIENV